MDTFLKDFYDFIVKQSEQGGVEIRMVATIDPVNGNVTAYAHPYGKNGDTFDFQLVQIHDDGVVMCSNPFIKKVADA